MEVVLLPIYDSVSIYLDGAVDWVNCLRGWAEDEIGGDVHARGVDYKSIRWNA